MRMRERTAERREREREEEREGERKEMTCIVQKYIGLNKSVEN